MPDNKKRASKETNDKLSFVKIFGISFFGVLVYFLLILIISFIALKADIDSSAYIPFGIGSGIVSGFICGFICAGAFGHSGMLYGGIAGAFSGAICGLILFALNSDGFGIGAVIVFASMLIAGGIGGILRVNKKKRIRY